jgi:hypothetical protein
MNPFLRTPRGKPMTCRQATVLGKAITWLQDAFTYWLKQAEPGHCGQYMLPMGALFTSD